MFRSSRRLIFLPVLPNRGVDGLAGGVSTKLNRKWISTPPIKKSIRKHTIRDPWEFGSDLRLVMHVPVIHPRMAEMAFPVVKNLMTGLVR